MHHDDVVLEEEPLLTEYVDVEVGILLVEVVEGHRFQAIDALGKHSIDSRLLERWVCEQDEHAMRERRASLGGGIDHLGHACLSA
jgi:hypothetical protein